MKEVERTIFAALVALAKSDGMIDPEERAWLREVLDQAGVAGEVSIEHAPALDHAKLRRLVASREDRLALLKFGLMVTMADGNVSPKEYDFLKVLAGDLEISEEELEQLRHETVLAVEPGD